MHVVRRMDLQQAISDWQIANIDFEMHQDFKQRGGRILRAIDDPPTTGVPSSCYAQPAVTRERQLIADPPEKHLGSHALVDPVQRLFDEARARFSRGELQRAAAVELPLGGTQPVP